jgi:hypothetical protein
VAFCRSVLQEDNILCKLYAYTRSDVSDNNDNDILYSDSNVPITSSWKQLRPSATVFTSDSETSKEHEESSEPESSDDKTSDVWCKTDLKKKQWSFPLNHRFKCSE